MRTRLIEAQIRNMNYIVEYLLTTKTYQYVCIFFCAWPKSDIDREEDTLQLLFCTRQFLSVSSTLKYEQRQDT